MLPTEAPVAVAGGGAAGLAAAASLRREGVEPVVLEAAERIGGTWARRYDRLHLHTVRRFSGLPYRPLERALPRYVAKDDYARYLADYAHELALDVRLGHRVERVEPLDGRWVIGTSEGDLTADAVVIATGKHNLKHVPPWPGSDEFRGPVVHSADYRSGAELAGRRVLVVGIGNSGAEIATDLVECGAAFVAIAVRTPPPIVRRETAGVPAQLLGMLLAPFPPRAVDRVAAAARRVAIGDLRRYGLDAARWGTFEARRPPLIDVGFLDMLRAGRIVVRPAVTRLTPTGAVFAGGAEERFDAVVAATGFTSSLADILAVGDLLDERGLPLARRDGSTAHAGLYFIGFRESPRGVLYETSRDARRLAEAVARYLAALPAAASG
jgi:putative flavoprotein involved in K+ transport